MVGNVMSHAAPMIRKVWAFAAPTMVVGIVLVSQALGRTQVQHSSALSESKAQIHARASGGANATIKADEKAVNSILAHQNVLLSRDSVLFNRQAAVNQLLFRLTQVVPTTKAQWQSVIHQSSRDLALFYNLQGKIQFNEVQIGRSFSIFTPRLQSDLASLSQFAPSNAAVAQFILAAELRLMAQEQQYEAILARSPATPFIPNPPFP
jgi:hypothetical protein